MATIAHLGVKLGIDTSRMRRGSRTAIGVIDNIRDRVRRLDKSLGGIGGGLRKSIGSTFSGLKSQMVANIQGAVVIGSAALASLPVAAVAASGGIVAALGGGLAAVGIAAAAQSKKVKSHFTALKNHVISILRDISQPFEGTLIRISGMAKRTFNSFVPALEQSFAQMAPAITGFADQFFNSLKRLIPAIQPLTDAFTTLLEKLGPRLPTIMSNLSDGVIAVANAISGNSGAFVNLIVSISKIVNWGLRLLAFFTRFPAVAAVVVGVLAALAVAFGGPVIAIAGVVAAIIALVTLIMVKFPAIKKAIVGAWNAVRSATVGAWNKVRGAVTRAAQAVWNVIRRIWRGIVRSVRRQVAVVMTVIGFFAKLPGRVGRWFGRMRAAAVARLVALVGFVRSIPGRIRSALGNLGKLLFSAGRNIVSGLIDGIKSMLGAVADAAGNVASTVRDFLPFSPAKRGPLSGSGSPDKAGRTIAAMLAAGMDRDARAVKAAASRVAGAAAIGIATPATPNVPGVRGARRGDPPAMVIDSSGAPIDDLLLEVLRKSIRVRGGDVQTVLGR